MVIAVIGLIGVMCKMISIQSVESMLESWARFYYQYSFGGLGYPGKSLIKPEIKSTKPVDDVKIPNDVESIDIAIIKLTPKQRLVVNAEYLKEGHYKAKAANIEISDACYRSTLSQAKKNIIKSLETILTK